MNAERLPQDLATRFQISEELGFSVNKKTLILDFGCGSGKKVQDLRNLGFQAFGCGTRFNSENGVDTKSMLSEGIIREINTDRYELPFKDNSFDFIFSESVFEHVTNYPETISELARVLKPEGLCLHSFVSRYKPIEAHVMVPFASVFKTYWWLYIWVMAGCKNEWQDVNGIKERVSRYLYYLKTETNYLTRKQLKKHFRLKFNEVMFCEDLFLKYSPGRRRHLYSISKFLPFVANLFSAFQMRIIMTRMPEKKTSV